MTRSSLPRVVRHLDGVQFAPEISRRVYEDHVGMVNVAPGGEIGVEGHRVAVAIDVAVEADELCSRSLVVGCVSQRFCVSTQVPPRQQCTKRWRRTEMPKPGAELQARNQFGVSLLPGTAIPLADDIQSVVADVVFRFIERDPVWVQVVALVGVRGEECPGDVAVVDSARVLHCRALCERRESA